MTYMYYVPEKPIDLTTPCKTVLVPLGIAISGFVTTCIGIAVCLVHTKRKASFKPGYGESNQLQVNNFQLTKLDISTNRIEDLTAILRDTTLPIDFFLISCWLYTCNTFFFSKHMYNNIPTLLWGFLVNNTTTKRAIPFERKSPH